MVWELIRGCGLIYWGEPERAPQWRVAFVRLSVYVGLTIFKVNKLLTLIGASLSEPGWSSLIRNNAVLNNNIRNHVYSYYRVNDKKLLAFAKRGSIVREHYVECDAREMPEEKRESLPVTFLVALLCR